MNTSLPSRKMSARKPSHLGSKIHAPALGSSLTRFASIGRMGGLTGSSIICVFDPQITRIDCDVASPRKRSGRYRFRGLSWPPHQGHSLRPRSRTSGLRTPESAEAPLRHHVLPRTHTWPPTRPLKPRPLSMFLAERSTMHSPHNE